MSPDKIDQIYHSETVLDLFGHCCELVGDIQVALDAYNTLLRGMPRNNAANWHKQRLEQIMKNYNKCVVPLTRLCWLTLTCYYLC